MMKCLINFSSLQLFDGIECEFPLFFIFMIIDGKYSCTLLIFKEKTSYRKDAKLLSCPAGINHNAVTLNVSLRVLPHGLKNPKRPTLYFSIFSVNCFRI